MTHENILEHELFLVLLFVFYFLNRSELIWLMEDQVHIYRSSLLKAHEVDSQRPLKDHLTVLHKKHLCLDIFSIFLSQTVEDFF